MCGEAGHVGRGISAETRKSIERVASMPVGSMNPYRDVINGMVLVDCADGTGIVISVGDSDHSQWDRIEFDRRDMQPFPGRVWAE